MIDWMNRYGPVSWGFAAVVWLLLLALGYLLYAIVREKITYRAIRKGE